jgi:hypothetical protein
LYIKAGLHTSEWAWDRSDVRPIVRHSRAQIFENFPSVDDNGAAFDGHHFVAIFEMPRTGRKGLRLDWIGSPGMISLQQISLRNESANQSYSITREADYLHDANRWRREETVSETTVYENVRAMPRAWLVPRVVSLRADLILNSIRESTLPDGIPYDPSEVALIEDPITFDSTADPEGSANVVSLSETQLDLVTHSRVPAFLVLSDVYYPGWQVTVDGQLSRIYRTNFALRGVQVPAGDHVVQFRFRPLSFKIGVLLSTVTLLLVSIVALKQHFGRARLSGTKLD